MLSRPPGKSIFTNSCLFLSFSWLRGCLDLLVVDTMSLMVPSYMMPEQLRLARVQLCVGLFLFRPAAFSPAAAQPHEQAERKSGRPRKGTAVAVQGTGKVASVVRWGLNMLFSA